MYYLDRGLHYLICLPHRVRLSIVVLCFPLTLVLFLLNVPAPLDGSLFSIPVALAVWLFKRQGAMLGVGGTILALVLGNSLILGTLLWPLPVISAFAGGVIALLVEALFILFLRNSLDVADTARLKAQQAEQQLTLAYEQQRELNQIKDQFLINVNHELRTPLTELHGYLELLQEYGGQLDVTTQADFLSHALHGCEELQLLVNNVLDAVRVTHGGRSLKYEALSVLTIVGEVLDQFDPRCLAEYRLTLDIPTYLTACADAQYLRQILRNLLSNAFKYAPLHTPIIIQAECIEHRDQKKNNANQTPAPNQICISVKDAGPGIPPGELPLLFNNFVRLKRDLAGTIRGSGLGLYVSKQLVEAMGGTIWAESSGIPGEGSRFCFTLPSASAPIVPEMLQTL